MHHRRPSESHGSSHSEIGIIGDVHAEDAVLENVLAFFADRGINQILCTGDVSDGMGNLDRCVRLLTEARCITVSGNHDRWLLEDEMRMLPFSQLRSTLEAPTLDYLRNLPATVSLKLADRRILLCHGVGGNDMNFLNPDDSGYAIESNMELQELMRRRQYHLMIDGHTHKRTVRRFGPLWNINAGTLIGDQEPSVCTLDKRQLLVRTWSISPSGLFTEEAESSLV